MPPDSVRGCAQPERWERGQGQVSQKEARPPRGLATAQGRKQKESESSQFPLFLNEMKNNSGKLIKASQPEHHKFTFQVYNVAAFGH